MDPRRTDAGAPRAWTIALRASAMEGEERVAWLRAECGDDLELLREVQSLLGCESDSPTELDRPVLGSGFALDEVLGDDPKAGPLAPGSTLVPGHRVLRIVGHGSSGTVYLARQEHPPREVAVKVSGSSTSEGSAVRRFVAEIEALARLRHPGIARIYEAGSFDDPLGSRGYFTMEYVPGRTLTDHATAQRLTDRQRLELLAQVADAIHHAHEQGIVHRDLKPENILVDVDGQPKVLDFGVARIASRLRADTDAATEAPTLGGTNHGQLLGTLDYMAPEQLDGSRESDARTDVYALGLVGHELLTGEPVRRSNGTSFEEAAEEILRNEPEPLGERSRAWRGDLELIFRTALNRNAGHRYPSAAAFAEDLRRCIEHRPLSVREHQAPYVLGKLVQRRRGLVLGLALLASTLAVGLVGWRHLDRQRELDSQWTEFIADLDRKERGAGWSGQSASDVLMVAAAEVEGVFAEPEGRARALSEIHARLLAAGQHGLALEVLSEARATVLGASDVDPELEFEIECDLARLLSQFGSDMDRVAEHVARARELAEGEAFADGRELLGLERTYRSYLSQAGRHEEALAGFEEIIESRRAEEDRGQEKALNWTRKYVRLLWSAGRLDEAERIARDGFAEATASLPPDHGLVAGLGFDLAIVLVLRSETDGCELPPEADELVRAATEESERDHGFVHAWTLYRHLYRARVLALRGRLVEAEELLARVVDGYAALRLEEATAAVHSAKLLAELRAARP